jgi:hypothetical protein
VVVECLLSIHLLISRPIVTYGHKGAIKGGLRHADHAVIYTGDSPPEALLGEPFLVRGPIQVLPKTSRDRLARESRINYAKIYTVEHNVKVAFVGQISEGSKRQFVLDFDSVWASKTKIT